jgi:hypothetical protein
MRPFKVRVSKAQPSLSQPPKVQINYPIIDAWADGFIPEIADKVICLTNPDHHKRERYSGSLESRNYENDFHAAHDATFNPNGHEPPVTSSVRTVINGERLDLSV